MNTVVRVLPPGKLASARPYILDETDIGSGYMHSTFRPDASTARSYCCRDVPLSNPVQHGADIAAEQCWIFTHREMTELVHDDDLRTLDARRCPRGISGHAREIVLTRQKKQRAPGGVDGRNAAAQVAVDPIEIEVTLENARPALLIRPQRFLPRRLRTLGSDQARDQ